MLVNNVKIALRNIMRHKGFSFLNIAGLTLGLTACLLIGLFVRDEKSFDKFIPNGERIFRVHYAVSNNEGESVIATTSPMIATALQEQFPETDKTARVLNLGSKYLFEAGDKKLYEEKGVAAEPAFLEIFPLSFLYGSAVNALSDPASILLSSGMAQRFFGKENPVGKQITFDKDLYVVKGVFNDDVKFHLELNYIIPLAATGLSKEMLANWQWYGMNTYVRLKEGADALALQAKLQQYTAPFLKGEGGTYATVLQPLHKIHLHSASFKYDIAKRGDITYVKALSIIALFILLIACLNFVNLATAKSMQRAKEVGVRKTIGAGKSKLIIQFLSESVLLTSISIVLSIVCTYFLLPLLNTFTEKTMVFDLFTNPLLAVSLIGLTLVIGVLAGFYPAIVLSNFKPIHVLKGSVATDSQAGKTPWLRHGLVVLQFSLSILLIISAIVVYRQVNFLHSKDLGFEKEQIMFFPMRGENMSRNYETFKTQLQQSPGVSGVSIGYGFPGDMFGDGLMRLESKAEQAPVKATQLMVDQDYIKTLGLQLVAGRDFSKDIKTDPDEAFIINETAMREFGFSTPQQALGQTLSWPTWKKQDSLKKAQIIGIVKDFHFKSLYEKVEPAVLQIYPSAYSKVAVKLKTAEAASTIAHVQHVWKKFSADYPLEYNFLDESFAQMYKADDKLRSLLGIFTSLTIIVACLGLFGLSAYAAERRRKEIGIRKVLGASVHSVVALLSANFVKLVLVALLIASPVAWYFMNQWLQSFAYRISVDWWVFAIAGLSAVLIALITVSFQAIKAALSNPVKSLRTE